MLVRLLSCAIVLSWLGPVYGRPGGNTYYSFDQPGMPTTVDRYEVFITWESAPIRGAIYPGLTLGFQAGGGYMGTQLEGTERKVLFSVWDVADGAHSALPMSPTCRRFGDDANLEGTGAQCGFSYPWIEGREYRMRLEKIDSVDEGDDWRCTITDIISGVETTVGTIRLLDTQQGGISYQGYGGLRPGSTAFMEYFGGPETCDDQPYVRIRWRGPYAGPDALPPSSAVASSYSCPTHNDQWSPGVPVVVVAAGGNATPITHINTRLWPPCEYGFDLDNGLVQVANAACFDPSLVALATTTSDVSNYSTWTYPNGSPVQGTASAVANGTDGWVVFYKQPSFAGESFCLGPHRMAQLFDYPGWNDVVASHDVRSGSTPPAGCAVQITPGCGDSILEPARGEQCDDGPTAANGCCDANCQLKPLGAACQDGDMCTSGDSCDAQGICRGSSGCGDGAVDSYCGETCERGTCCDARCHAEPVGTPCDEPVCIAGAACDANGLCVGGTRLECVDSNPATRNVCKSGIGCTFDDVRPAQSGVVSTYWQAGSLSMTSVAEPQASDSVKGTLKGGTTLSGTPLADVLGTVGDDWEIAVFDKNGGVYRSVFQSTVECGGMCGARPCCTFTQTPTTAKFKFVTTAPNATGAKKLNVTVSTRGSKVKFAAGGGPLSFDPWSSSPLMLQSDEAVLQVCAKGAEGDVPCWQYAFGPPARVTTATRFRDNN